MVVGHGERSKGPSFCPFRSTWCGTGVLCRPGWKRGVGWWNENVHEVHETSFALGGTMTNETTSFGITHTFSLVRALAQVECVCFVTNDEFTDLSLTHSLVVSLSLSFVILVHGLSHTFTRHTHGMAQGVRTKTVKKSARTIVEKYYTRLTMDFHTNKRIIDEIAITPSKRMRNKIAGFTTHLMKRIDKGPVRGISLKLQEEERERRLDFVPEVSALEQDTITIDPDTRNMLESLGYGGLQGVAVNERS